MENFYVHEWVKNGNLDTWVTSPQGIDIKSFKIRVSRRCQTQVEGFNGYARPLDTMIRARDYRLYNINNLKLARFTEIFPGAAKTDAQRCGDSMVSSVLTQSS